MSLAVHVILLSAFIILGCHATCPAIVKTDMKWDNCVRITNDVPQNKTIFVDDCDGDKVCDFKGKPFKYVWPARQIDLNSNSATYKYMYNNLGTDEFGYLEGYCKHSDQLLGSTKLHGERCNQDRECLLGNCDPDSGRCIGLGPGDICTATNQCQSGYYCTGNVCTVVQAQGNPCTSDDDCAIDMICAANGNTCEYLYHQVDNTTVGDARMCISGMKTAVSGTNGECRTTGYVQQNGVNLTDLTCDPNSANLCDHFQDVDQLYPENLYNDMTQLFATVSGPLDCHCLYNSSGYCMMYGNTSYYDLHDYWKNNIVSKLKTYCHQSRRFNIAAWVACQENMNDSKLNYFIDLAFNLSSHPYIHNEDYWEYVSTMDMKSPRNWAKINHAQGLGAIGVIVLGVMGVIALW